MTKLRKYKLSYSFVTEVEAENEEEAKDELAERWAMGGTSAESEFWENLEVEDLGELQDD